MNDQSGYLKVAGLFFSITKCDQAERKIEPAAGAKDPDQQNHPERRADEMQQTGGGLAVFRHVKIPEFRVCFNFLLTHFFL